MNPGPSREPLPENFSDEGDVISLAPLWELIRKYHRWLEVGLGILLVVGVGLLGALWLVLPKQSRATMDISFLFPDRFLRFMSTAFFCLCVLLLIFSIFF